MKTPKHKLYSLAEDMFVEQGFTAQGISEQTGLSEKTLSGWRNSMKWDMLREEHLTSPEKVRKLLRQELKNVAEGKETKIDTDALSKIAKTLQYYDGRVALSVVISVFKEFDNWMAEVDPHMAVQFLEYHKKFFHHRATMDSLK